MEAEREERDVGGEVRANLMGEVGNHILARRLVGDEDDATRGDNRISRPKDMDATGKFDERREYELPEGAEGTYEEDDVVAYIYDEDDNEIKEILYVLSPV